MSVFDLKYLKSDIEMESIIIWDFKVKRGPIPQVTGLDIQLSQLQCYAFQWTLTVPEDEMEDDEFSMPHIIHWKDAFTAFLFPDLSLSRLLSLGTGVSVRIR